MIFGRILACCALSSLVLLPLVARGQGFSCFFYYASDGGAPLTISCSDTTPLADGALVKVFWDRNGNGPDPTDPQPVLCDTPRCETPAGALNFIEFKLNGQEQELGAGYFAMTINLTSIGRMPKPPRYYFRVYDSDGKTVLWTSTAYTMVMGYQEVGIKRADWTCSEREKLQAEPRR